MISVSVLVEKLNSMDCASIRALLASEGVTGTPRVETACPIANWIYSNSGVYAAVGTHRKSAEFEWEFGIHALASDLDSSYEGELFPMGRGAVDFIQCFDSEKFPELMDNPPPAFEFIV